MSLAETYLDLDAETPRHRSRDWRRKVEPVRRAVASDPRTREGVRVGNGTLAVESGRLVFTLPAR